MNPTVLRPEHFATEVAHWIAGQAREAIAAASGPQRLPSQTAIQYVLKHPAVTSAVVGIRTAQQLEEAAAEVERLDAMEYETLTRAVPVKDYAQHR